MVVDCAEVEIMDARFGINLQSMHKLDGVLGLSMSSVNVIVGGAAFTSALILLGGSDLRNLTKLTTGGLPFLIGELNARPAFRPCSLSLCEGVMLMLIEHVLGILAHNVTASGSNSPSVTPAAPLGRNHGTFGKLFQVVVGEVGRMSSSMGTSYHILVY